MRRAFACCLLAIVALGIASPNLQAADVETRTPARQLVESEGVLVIAHRGASHEAPENTLPAFASAVEAGSDLVELDYHHSSDGVPVVLHDAILDRTTNSAQLFGMPKVHVGSKSREELSQLDAGSWYDRRFSGTKIPSLEEALHTIQNGSTTLIERKYGDARTCVNLLNQLKLTDQVVVQSFDWQYVRDCRQESAGLVLAALGGRKLDEKSLDKIQEIGANVVAWHKDSLDTESIRKIHDRGFRAWAWTVDKPEEAGKLVDSGIDAIITNEPRKVALVVKQRGKTAKASRESAPSEAALGNLMDSVDWAIQANSDPARRGCITRFVPR
jgi:glycerophosphoryl diester phosphodiesterase